MDEAQCCDWHTKVDGPPAAPPRRTCRAARRDGARRAELGARHGRLAAPRVRAARRRRQPVSTVVAASAVSTATDLTYIRRRRTSGGTVPRTSACSCRPRTRGCRRPPPRSSACSLHRSTRRCRRQPAPQSCVHLPPGSPSCSARSAAHVPPVPLCAPASRHRAQAREREPAGAAPAIPLSTFGAPASGSASAMPASRPSRRRRPWRPSLRPVQPRRSHPAAWPSVRRRRAWARAPPPSAPWRAPPSSRVALRWSPGRSMRPPRCPSVVGGACRTRWRRGPAP